MTKYPRFYPVLDKEIERMTKILGEGLPKCYTSFDDFLCDYWPDFAWTDEAMLAQFNTLEASAEWLSLAAQIKTVRGFDFVTELKNARVAIMNGD